MKHSLRVMEHDWSILEVLCITVTINTFCLIAIDRYVAVTRPLHYPIIVTINRSRLSIILVWFLAAAISFFPITLGWWKSDLPAAQTCYDDEECCDLMANETFIIVSSIFAFFLPLGIMLFVYNRIFKEANHQVVISRFWNDRGSNDNFGGEDPLSYAGKWYFLRSCDYQPWWHNG